MLQSVNLSDKTYIEMLEEAVSQIPLYGSEWTNFNVSDPAMTVLQNFTSFHYLQREAVNTVTDAIKIKLLKLIGLEPKDAAGAYCLFESKDSLSLPPYSKFFSDGTVFETIRAERHKPWGISAVYSESGGVFTDVTTLLDRNLSAGAAVFGSPARAGASFCCILDEKPDFSKKTILYIRTVNDPRRNPFEGGDEDPVFAELRWQLYTDTGWTDLPACDNTHGLLTGGDVVIEKNTLTPAIFEKTPQTGYAIRCLLESQEYDFPPKLHSVTANLLHLQQRDTLAVALTKRGGTPAVLNLDAELYPYIWVYGRERPDGPHLEYKRAGKEPSGRFYTIDRDPSGMVRITFDRERFGYAPASGTKNVIILCCTEEMARRRSLGKVFGYVDQVIEVGKNITEFCALVEREGADGIPEYALVKPGEMYEDFSYELNAREGNIVIKNPGWGYSLYAASCAVTSGAAGNIKEENLFTSHDGIELRNPAPGRGGIDPAGLAEMQKDFSGIMKYPESAVLVSDYERIVKSTPGLCIHKVRADTQKGTISIAVKPHFSKSNRTPVLPPNYIESISKRLEKRRMLTTKFTLEQPVYAPVDVRATVYVKSHFAGAEESVRETLGRVLDQISSDAGFGSEIKFNDVFQAVSGLPCVLSVYSLVLTPRPGCGASLSGMDILPDPNCLCYPGNITLEINTGSMV